MTPSELAFLALGLALGVTAGAAIVVILRTHPSPHEVKVTVARDAVPRRPATLSMDAFASLGEVARGGPADRRAHDRDFPALNDPPRPVGGFDLRTAVLSAAAASSRVATAGRQSGGSAPVGLVISPEPDPDLASLRASMAVAAEQAIHAGEPTAIGILERPRLEVVTTMAEMPLTKDVPAEVSALLEPVTDEAASAESATETRTETLTEAQPAILPILRGDRRLALRVVAALAPAARPVERIVWGRRIDGLIAAIVHAAIDEGMLDIPAGNHFWDPFDRDQTRSILRALAAHGHRPDGAGGWLDGHAPTGRQLAAALADAGLDPRRIRPWPIDERISDLVHHATVAADEFLVVAAPDLALDEIRALVGDRIPPGMAKELWARWDEIRELLLAEPAELARRAALPA